MTGRFDAHEDGSDGSGPGVGSRGPETAAPGRLLELLGDETSRRVLRAVAERPRGGREVAEALAVSRATAYRRLNDLQEAGLVTTDFTLDPDGHHHKKYTATLEELTVRLDGDDIDATVATAEERADHQTDDGTVRSRVPAGD